MREKHASVPRVATFGRFLHVLEPHYSQADLDFFLRAFTTVRQKCGFQKGDLIPRPMGFVISCRVS